MVYLGLPINSMVIFHGELLVINRWYIYGTSVHIYICGISIWYIYDDTIYLYGISIVSDTLGSIIAVKIPHRSQQNSPFFSGCSKRKSLEFLPRYKSENSTR